MTTRRDVLKAAAVAAAAPVDDVTDAELSSQRRRLLDLGDRDEDERWEYEPTRNLAHVRSGLLNAELDNLCQEPGGTLATYPVGSDGIPLGFEVSTGDESIGTMVHLSSDQAEALAVDLLEQAHAARQVSDQ